MMGLLAAVDAYSVPVGTILGAVGGIYSMILKERISARHNQLGAGRQALDLVARISAREERSDALIAAYMVQFEAAHCQRINDMVRLDELYAAAIAARLVVYELDAAAGRPPREFPRLPPCPAPLAAISETPVSGRSGGL